MNSEGEKINYKLNASNTITKLVENNMNLLMD